jgi:hypothetical protein
VGNSRNTELKNHDGSNGEGDVVEPVISQSEVVAEHSKSSSSSSDVSSLLSASSNAPIAQPRVSSRRRNVNSAPPPSSPALAAKTIMEQAFAEHRQRKQRRQLPNSQLVQQKQAGNSQTAVHEHKLTPTTPTDDMNVNKVTEKQLTTGDTDIYSGLTKPEEEKHSVNIPKASTAPLQGNIDIVNVSSPQSEGTSEAVPASMDITSSDTCSSSTENSPRDQGTAKRQGLHLPLQSVHCPLDSNTVEGIFTNIQ